MIITIMAVDVTSMTKRILVALSGGVDSSVCVHLLKEQGYEVEAAVIEFSPAHSAAVEAAKVAAELRRKYHMGSLRKRRYSHRQRQLR